MLLTSIVASIAGGTGGFGRVARIARRIVDAQVIL